jgi:glucosamine-6-phosphate deaminase
VHADRAALGTAAAAEIAQILSATLAERATARVVFAAAPSQQETLWELRARTDIDWWRITAFHMDEYLGLDDENPRRFSNWLRANLFEHVRLGEVHYIRSAFTSPEQEIDRYSRLITAEPIDLVVLGIGVNGHLAFNDPPADLTTAAVMQRVALAESSRRQQVDDGLFDSLDAVPRSALTLTVPALLSARRMVCVVPGRSKAAAVRAALEDDVSGACPATALRTHRSVTLHLDEESASDWARLL